MIQCYSYVAMQLLLIFCLMPRQSWFIPALDEALARRYMLSRFVRREAA